MNDCIFCKIVGKEIFAPIIYEDELFMGFLDNHPATEGHTLLIPKKHFRWVHDVEPFGVYWETARKIMYLLDKSLHPKWTQYFTHGFVPHAHIHIIPRYDDINNAKDFLQQPNEPEDNDILINIAKKIRNG